MSQNRRNYTAANDKITYRNSGQAYMYGSVAPARQPQVDMPVQAPRRQNGNVPSHEVRKNREKALHMSAGYVLFLITALLAAAFVLVNYIQLQAELTGLSQTVTVKERELNALRLENDEAYNRVIRGIDLEEIRRIAIQELGMVYAEEGQIVIYENEGYDYMRQVTEDKQ